MSGASATARSCTPAVPATSAASTQPVLLLTGLVLMAWDWLFSKLPLLYRIPGATLAEPVVFAVLHHGRDVLLRIDRQYHVLPRALSLFRRFDTMLSGIILNAVRRSNLIAHHLCMMRGGDAQATRSESVVIPPSAVEDPVPPHMVDSMRDFAQNVAASSQAVQTLHRSAHQQSFSLWLDNVAHEVAGLKRAIHRFENAALGSVNQATTTAALADHTQTQQSPVGSSASGASQPSSPMVPLNVLQPVTGHHSHSESAPESDSDMESVSVMQDSIISKLSQDVSQPTLSPALAAASSSAKMTSFETLSMLLAAKSHVAHSASSMRHRSARSDADSTTSSVSQGPTTTKLPTSSAAVRSGLRRMQATARAPM